MAQKYYNVSEAAAVLGISADEIRQMLERRELHGYRDGADWKFKTELIDKMKEERAAAGPSDDDQDVLLSEVELGESAIGASGTVIGLDPKGDAGLTAASSDIALADDAPAAEPVKAAGESKVSAASDLDLILDADASLDLAGSKKPVVGESSIDVGGSKLEDDELVLGGSKTGSGVTLGGDSGISLVDLADSGISLEEPLTLNAGGDESLELGEDDMLTLSTEASSPSIKGEDDFQLTPLSDGDDGDDSESGSQVIALDSEGDEGATMLGIAPQGMAAMLEEDLSTLPLGDPGAGLPAGMGLGAMGGPSLQPAADGVPYQVLDLPEAPYTGLNIAALAICTVLLIFCGMFMTDLMRNMWSWEGAGSATSPIMDWILSLV